MVSRVYFGNWLRDYSQAVDVGALKGVNAATIRILVCQLSALHAPNILARSVNILRSGFFPSWRMDMPPKSSRLPKSAWVVTDLKSTSTTLLVMPMARMLVPTTNDSEVRLTRENSRLTPKRA